MIQYKDFLNRLQNSHEYERYITGVCPFHTDSDPSILVFKDGWFKCLGCNRQGSWQMLWNKLSGQNIIIRPDNRTSWSGPTFDSSLEQLCYQSHLDLMQFSSYQWYLKERGLENRMELNELGYYEGWYTIPVTSEDGQFITAVFRSSPHVQHVTGLRYICKHVPVPFYPDHSEVHRHNFLFVVYGILDALTLADMHLPVVTSTAGKDTFNPEWLDTHRKQVFIIPDKGEESTAYGLASCLDFRGRVINLEFPDGVKDCNGFYEKGKGDLLERQLRNVITKYTKVSRPVPIV